jgi:sugar-specific transcriptional regulator TrmB
MENIEMVNRKDNLVFSGLQSTYADAATNADARVKSIPALASMMNQVIEIVNKVLYISLNEYDISYIQPISKKFADSQNSSVIVRFVQRKLHDDIFFANLICLQLIKVNLLCQGSILKRIYLWLNFNCSTRFITRSKKRLFRARGLSLAGCKINC